MRKSSDVILNKVCHCSLTAGGRATDGVSVREMTSVVLPSVSNPLMLLDANTFNSLSMNGSYYLCCVERDYSASVA